MVEVAERSGVASQILLSGALAKDSDAERRFFDAVQADLVERARRHRLMAALAATTTPEDVASEVVTRCLAARAFEDFRDTGRGSLQRFLGVVLERTLLDQLRRARTAKRWGLALQRHGEAGRGDAPPVEPPSRDPTPTSSARASELLRLCQRLLAGRELQVWRMAEFEGLRAVDIAPRLGITSSTARSLLHRARRKLIRALTPQVQPGS